MTTLTAIAFDPGGTTGWSMYQADISRTVMTVDGKAKVLEHLLNEKWFQGQLGPEEHGDDLVTLLEMNHTPLYYVIVERFIPRPDKIGAKLEVAPRYITIIERFVHERNAEEAGNVLSKPIWLHMQMPAQAKGFVKDNNIKKLGLWSPGQRHAMDATRHLLLFLINHTGKRDELLEKGWKF